jgi:hypothetical protein
MSGDFNRIEPANENFNPPGGFHGFNNWGLLSLEHYNLELNKRFPEEPYFSLTPHLKRTQ